VDISRGAGCVIGGRLSKTVIVITTGERRVRYLEGDAVEMAVERLYVGLNFDGSWPRTFGQP
jgi:hypothetical protein